MTITNQFIQPIQAGELPGGLTTTARRLPAGSDWTGGVTFTPGCGTAGVWGCVNDGSLKETTQNPDPVRFDPFMVYAAQECSGAPILDELGLYANAALNRAQSSLLARELVVSDPLIGNPDLTSVATDITPGGPTSFRATVAGLLTAVRECGGGEVMLHVPLIAMPFLDAVGVRWDGTGWSLGPIPVSVDDYLNPNGDPPSDPDNAYIYLTRPVEYEIGPTLDLREYRGRLNEAVVVAERLAIVRFDPCCAYMANVDFGA